MKSKEWLMTAKADALLEAGDALSDLFPAKSKELLRLCRHYREKARDCAARDE